MRTNDPQVLAQIQASFLTGGPVGAMSIPAQQFQGVLDAIILDTDATNDTLPAGTCRVTMESYTTQMAFGPMYYPGVSAPPSGTLCEVGFLAPSGADASGVGAVARVLTLYGFGGGGDGSASLSPFLLMGA